MLLECKNLKKNYGEVEALKGINLKIPKGKIVGLLGTNGSGKTTLIKLINGLLMPTAGEVLINGQKPGIDSKKIIAYLPEKNALNQEMKINDLINFFEDFYADFKIEKANKLLKILDIDLNKRLKTLSKGTKEKVSLALTMSRDADLYVLDEPIGGVDPAARDMIIETIINNFNPEASILISTHLVADIEKVLDEVIFLNKGEIILEGNADDLRSKRKKSIDAIFREEFKC